MAAPIAPESGIERRPCYLLHSATEGQRLTPMTGYRGTFLVRINGRAGDQFDVAEFRTMEGATFEEITLQNLEDVIHRLRSFVSERVSEIGLGPSASGESSLSHLPVL
ncbi:MAG: hypothetical protein A3E01_10695 [Gammaproteobacteria bacterium RIFCSPHIGHO2_12_FULL_63_22]|nr:MAG: hypothetical protein A3E01_10695 [Gammaproteobacteria bacterium RIFCSPHIGHO2_12_FULL_63_22]